MKILVKGAHLSKNMMTTKEHNVYLQTALVENLSLMMDCARTVMIIRLQIQIDSNALSKDANTMNTLRKKENVLHVHSSK